MRGTECRRFKKNEIKLLGTVTKIEREYKPTGLMQWGGLPQETEQEKPGEKTVTCDSCQSTLTGSVSFLKGMGWKLQEDRNYCVECR
jgi:hypothetical protein